MKKLMIRAATVMAMMVVSVAVPASAHAAVTPQATQSAVPGSSVATVALPAASMKKGCKSKAFTQKYAVAGVTFYGINYSVAWCWTAAGKNYNIRGSATTWDNGPNQTRNAMGPTNSSRVPISSSWKDSDGSTNVYFWFQSRSCLTGNFSVGCSKWEWHRHRLLLKAGGSYQIVSRS